VRSVSSTTAFRKDVKRAKKRGKDLSELKKVIDRYVYTGQAPLPDPDIAEIILNL
jgi:mRNA-degrading endonuclease YafQ of YafQ-DinJ toxin-antitoxin module